MITYHPGINVNLKYPGIEMELSPFVTPVLLKAISAQKKKKKVCVGGEFLSTLCLSQNFRENYASTDRETQV